MTLLKIRRSGSANFWGKYLTKFILREKGGAGLAAGYEGRSHGAGPGLPIRR